MDESETALVDEVQVVTRYRLRMVAEGEMTVPETCFDRSATVARHLWLALGDRPQETMVAAFLDMRNMVVGWQEVFQGSLTRCTAEPRAILQAALLLNAGGIVLGHNHPTGYAEASPADVEFTVRMRRAAELVGIRLVDHVIVGDGGQWVSLRNCAGW